MGTAAKVWHRCRCAKTDGGAPMTQVDDLSRSLIAFERNSTMVVVLEMSQSSWLAAGVVPGIERRPLKKLDPDAFGGGLAGSCDESRSNDHSDRSGFRGRP